MTSENTKVTSAGGVIYKKENNILKVYLCHHKKHGYVLPKGRVETFETIKQAAEREVFEETGFRLTAGQELGKLSYNFDLNGQFFDKEVYFFDFPYVDQIQNSSNFENEVNIEQGKWVEISDIDKMIAHPSEAEICVKLNSNINALKQTLPE